MIHATEVKTAFHQQESRQGTPLKFQKKSSDSILSKIINIFHYLQFEHYRESGKRIWDFTSALVIFLSIWPMFAILAILIKFDSKGPVFYKQRRVGKKGEIFEVFKFRTMQDKSEHLNARTEENDSRITRIGKIIRPISLDEFPQLINILKGDMSFIGPRPLSEQEFNMVKDSGLLSKRMINNLVPKVRPGILGWAIFHGREKISYENRCELNKEYENKYSLLFDSYISFLTLKKYWLSYLVVVGLFILIPVLLLYQI